MTEKQDEKDLAEYSSLGDSICPEKWAIIS
jgi:hypothetical protein